MIAWRGEAATYYVQSGGDDSASGLSHDDAWRTLAKLRSFEFAPGDDVLLHEGDRWEGQVIVHWPGTQSDPVVIGAYYLENGVPTRGYETRRPVIDGLGNFPQQYDGLIRVRADRVRVENLELINSGGRAIQFEYADYAEAVDCVTHASYKSGIHFLRSQHVVARGNSVSRAGLASPLDGLAWGGAIEVVASNDATIAGNLVAQVYGEGINVNHGSARSIIENNYVFAARAVGIYLDAAPDTTVRRNIVIGTSDPEYWRGSRTVGAGIALNNEDYHYTVVDNPLPPSVQSRRAKIYDNLVAFTSSGVSFWGQLAESTFDGAMLFNNTFVDNDTQVTLGSKPKPGGKFVNNILLSLHASARDVDKNDLGGMTAKNNYFSQGDPGGDYGHIGNRYSGLVLTRMSGWRTVSREDQLSWRDFVVEEGSTVIGGGDDEPQRMSQGGDTFHLDFTGEEHNTPMDIGALRFSERDPKTPKRPTDVAGTPH